MAKWSAGVDDLYLRLRLDAGPSQNAGVPDLTTARRIERCLLKDNLDLVARRGALDVLPVLYETDNRRVGNQRVVTEEHSFLDAESLVDFSFL